MLDRVIATGRPVILSSGMSDLDELDAAVARVEAAGLPLAVLQCATAAWWDSPIIPAPFTPAWRAPHSA
jgi:sialic acid synthase SpsE